MKKNSYNWVWRWHFIGGLISLPIVILLSITGGIYLFKADYEKSNLEEITKVSSFQEALTYHDQWQFAQKLWDKSPDAMVLNNNGDYATEFISGMFSHKSKLFINPYSGKETGRIDLNQTDMYKVRKLHGELLLDSFGTKIVELVASWLVVLLITGVYLFWPRKEE